MILNDWISFTFFFLIPIWEKKNRDKKKKKQEKKMKKKEMKL